MNSIAPSVGTNVAPGAYPHYVWGEKRNCLGPETRSSQKEGDLSFELAGSDGKCLSSFAFSNVAASGGGENRRSWIDEMLTKGRTQGLTRFHVFLRFLGVPLAPIGAVMSLHHREKKKERER